MAQHVSASPNHQTGRSLPLKFRFDVAMSGRLGMELQPSAMSEDELAMARRAIADYKQVRHIVQQGDLYRIISPYNNKGCASLMYVTEDQTEAVMFCYKTAHYSCQTMPRMRMAGIDPDATYRITELNPKADGPCYLNDTTIKGSLLMDTGFEAPLWSEYSSCVLHLQKI
ncbi:MAG: GH36 C-terminal domain-containing protein [Bacteroidales bacterium]|nr:GH36 C-terminal domain-containing protein [Bacteroidales bacterium]